MDPPPPSPPPPPPPNDGPTTTNSCAEEEILFDESEFQLLVSICFDSTEETESFVERQGRIIRIIFMNFNSYKNSDVIACLQEILESFPQDYTEGYAVKEHFEFLNPQPRHTLVGSSLKKLDSSVGRSKKYNVVDDLKKQNERPKYRCTLCGLGKQAGRKGDPKNPPHVCVFCINVLARFVDVAGVVWYRIVGFDGMKWNARFLKGFDGTIGGSRTESKEEDGKRNEKEDSQGGMSEGRGSYLCGKCQKPKKDPNGNPHDCRGKKREPGSYLCGKCQMPKTDPNGNPHDCPIDPRGSKRIIGLFGGKIKIPMLAIPLEEEGIGNNKDGKNDETMSRGRRKLPCHDGDDDDLDKKPAAK